MTNIQPRSSWGARTPRSRSTTTWAARQEVTLHYSAGPESQTPRQIQNYHMDSQGWADIGYNFLVDRNGVAYEGRGWLVVGAHAAPRNTQGIGICYIGRDNMTDAAKRTVIALYDEANRRAGKTLARRGHRDINSTSCPGTNNFNWWKSANYRDVSGGGAVGGDDEMLGLKKGDKGSRVSYLQYMIRLAGQPYAGLLGTHGSLNDGVDGDYGNDTARALLKLRQDYGSSATDGDSVTHYAVGQIHAMVARNQSGR